MSQSQQGDDDDGRGLHQSGHIVGVLVRTYRLARAQHRRNIIIYRLYYVVGCATLSGHLQLYYVQELLQYVTRRRCRLVVATHRFWFVDK